MGISPAVLLRWQPERSEVSLSLVCVLANRVPIYFIVDRLPLVSLRIKLNCSTNKKVPPQIIQLSRSTERTFIPSLYRVKKIEFLPPYCNNFFRYFKILSLRLAIVEIETFLDLETSFKVLSLKNKSFTI